MLGETSFFFLIYLFIHLFNFWLHWVFAAARGLSLVAVSGDYSVAGRRLLIAVASCCRAQALGAWASVVVAHGLQ